MGYFSNGTEGDMYEEQYCNRCVHENQEKGCAVMLAHLLRNYEECNKKDSILHILIPRDENGFNKQCRMFIERPNPQSAETSTRCGAKLNLP